MPRKPTTVYSVRTVALIRNVLTAIGLERRATCMNVHRYRSLGPMKAGCWLHPAPGYTYPGYCKPSFSDLRYPSI